MIRTIFSKIYLKDRFYYSLGVIAGIFVFSLILPLLFYVALTLIAVVLFFFIYELHILYKSKEFILASRVTAPRLSLGDAFDIAYCVRNDSDIKFNATLYDEFPEQLQYRDCISGLILEPMEEQQLNFTITPKTRGIYCFGKVILYVADPRFQLAELRIDFELSQDIKVVPSILQMKKYSLYTLKKASHLTGIKKIRTIGENDEFELIRNYQQGDNIKSINWKATSRVNTLMVNQFQDTRSQEVFCIIDKGRTMEMPFNGMSLLDYSINSALVISNICLHKSDKAGLITFANTIDTYIKADSKTNQLQTILENLYAQQTSFKEHNFELLFFTLKSRSSRRSIIFLYSNFETMVDVERNLVYLEHLNKDHILILISFINTELELQITEKPVLESDEVYHTAMAQKLYFERFSIEKVLKNRGIQIIYTKPEDLNIAVINKYLEIKAKRIR